MPQSIPPHLPLLAATLIASLPSISHAVPDDPAATLAAEFSGRLAKVRYMEQCLPTDITLPGWEGFPTKRYTYHVKDKDGTTKSADVVMLNPTAEQISRWIVQALVEVKGAYRPDDGRKIFNHILAQSGGQFPVAGVVYEDILPADGVYETYCFRDGVTVEIQGVKHRGTTPLTKDQIESSISGKITRIFTYARIQSTSPQMWIAAGGSPDVLKDNKPAPTWLSEVRKSYQSAWNSNRNPLLVAWVKANIK